MTDPTRTIQVRFRPATPATEGAVEICEHKGAGHPDTLTDGLCEAASRALSLAYRRQCGRVLHHNLDKGLLIAGRSQPRFGGGQVLMPMRAILCGRATTLPDGGSAADLAVAAARRFVQSKTRLEIAVAAGVGETSGDLRRLFDRPAAVARANDTSFGVGYAPYSALELCVLRLAETLRSASFRASFPAAGADFKIMGCRRDGEVTLTLALAFVDRHVDGVGHYFRTKHAMHQTLMDGLAMPARLRINTLDDPHAQDESGLYLTVTGLSAEMGDDGQVGRGNRVNGLITPGRSMSLEAAAGKNPVAHVGKLYNVLALLIAREIHRQVEGADEVHVRLVSAIGAPVDQPQVAAVDVVARREPSAAARALAADIADRWLADIPGVTEQILDGRIALF